LLLSDILGKQTEGGIEGCARKEAISIDGGLAATLLTRTFSFDCNG